MGFSSKSTPPDPNRPLDPSVASLLQEKATENRLPCAVAFEIAQAVNLPPPEIGRHADALKIRLVKCQLGLFGYSPKNKLVQPDVSIPAEMENAIRQAHFQGRIPCKTLWRLAEQLHKPKLALGTACESLGVKISDCQLGAF